MDETSTGERPTGERSTSGASTGETDETLPFDPVAKIFSWPDARAWREGVRGRVVFTNGVFDLLHPGHVDVLTASRRAGDALVVGINDDASVKRLKGPERPVRSAPERAYVLAALEVVDAVVVFPQDTPLELIRLLEPDVLVKGGDYTEATIVGAPDVRAHGGDVIVVPLTPGHSTTATIAKLRDPAERAADGGIDRAAAGAADHAAH